MYTPHQSFLFPKGKSVKLWRYMDFTKYIAMLESQCLYFCRTDYLGDPYESSMPEGMVRKFLAEIHDLTVRNTEASLAKAQILHHNLSFLLRWSRHTAIMTYVNCWHMNNHESDAMWRVYIKGTEGVAVQSSPGRLVKSIEAVEQPILIGKVVYGDYEKLDLHGKDGGFNLFNFITRKRLSFRHEAELRAVIWKHPQATDEEGWIDSPSGIEVPVNLRNLIRAVYVSPSSPSWFRALVEAVNKRYGITAEVQPSRMAQVPPHLISADGSVQPPTRGITQFKFNEYKNE